MQQVFLLNRDIRDESRAAGFCTAAATLRPRINGAVSGRAYFTAM